MAIGLQEIARQRFALEQIADLRLDALVAAGDRGDGRGGRDRDQQRIAQAVRGDPCLQRGPRCLIVGHDVPQVELQRRGRSAGVRERGMRTLLFRQFTGGFQCVQIDPLGDARGQAQCAFAVERQAQLEEHVLQTHHPQPDRAPAQIGGARGFDRIEVEVDHPVQLPHRDAHGLAEFVEIEIPRAVVVERHVLGEIDRTQIADRGFFRGGHFDDLGAQVRQMHRAAGADLVAGAVGGVLERHPAVAGFAQHFHHPCVQVARLDGSRGQPLMFGLRIRALESLAPQVDEFRHRVRIEQRPVAVVLDPLHEQIGHPVGEIEIMGAAHLVAGIAAHFEEVLDIGVPGLQIDAGRALALAALVHSGHRRVQRLQPWHDAVAATVGGADQRAARADPRIRLADAAGELRQLRHVGVARVDVGQRIARRIQQEARRQLLVAGAGIEQRRRAGQVVQRRHQPIQLKRSVRRVGQRDRDAHEEMLRGLDHRALLRMAQQIAVVERPQAEILEAAALRDVDRIVELARMGFDHRAHAVVDQADRMPLRDRLRERMHALPRDFLVDIARQQARGEARVLRLVGGERGGGADRQLVEFAGRGAVVDAGDGLQRDAHRIDVVQPVAAALHGAHDLADIDRFAAAVALGDAHGGGRMRRRQRETGLSGARGGGRRCSGRAGGSGGLRRVVEQRGGH